MIITCHKCTTSFSLDDSLVKESGSKVRCSVCKEIFTVYPLSIEPESETEAAPELYIEPGSGQEEEFEDTSDFGSGFEPEFESDDTDFSLTDSDSDSDSETGFEMEDGEADAGSDDFTQDEDLSLEDDQFRLEEEEEQAGLELDEDELEFEDNAMEFETDDSEEEFDSIEFETFDEDDDSFSLEMEDSVTPLEIEEEPIPADEAAGPAEEEASLQDDEAGEDEDEFELEFDVEDEDKEIPALDDLGTGTLEGAAVESEALSLETGPDEETEDEDAPTITPEDDFTQYDEVLAQETDPDDDLLEEETRKTPDTESSEDETRMPPPAFPESSPRSRRKKSGSMVGKPVLILILLFLLLIGAYIASIMTGYKIPYLSDIQIPVVQEWLGKTAPDVSPAKPIPNQKSVNGRFVTNSTVGALFVITGRVENPSNVAYSHIEIRGALITDGKVEAKTKNAFCGNIITEEMLATGNISDINSLLMVKEGAHNSNVNIKPGGSIPFMVVFSDLPEKLQNFTVKVAGFEKAAPKK